MHFDEREPAEKDERGDVSERVEFQHAPLYHCRQSCSSLVRHKRFSLVFLERRLPKERRALVWWCDAKKVGRGRFRALIVARSCRRRVKNGSSFFPICNFLRYIFRCYFSKKRMFFSQQEKDVLDSHQIKESVYYSSLDSKRNDGNSQQKPVGFSMDETSTRDALKAFVNREMSSVAVRSVVVIVFFFNRARFEFVKH